MAFRSRQIFQLILATTSNFSPTNHTASLAFLGPIFTLKLAYFCLLAQLTLPSPLLGEQHMHALPFFLPAVIIIL